MFDLLVGILLLVGGVMMLRSSEIARRNGRAWPGPPGLRLMLVVYCIQGPLMIARAVVGGPVPFDAWLSVIVKVLVIVAALNLAVAQWRQFRARRSCVAADGACKEAEG
ncbi:MAG: hypothetical protein H6818_00395 [Phycisphaerales bacterium]|nr:hypothetical protein [Phycisphaerales bacterium]